MGLDGQNGTGAREAMLSFLDALYGYGMALTRNATEAEDLVQDTYMQATLHCDGLRRDSNVKAWMFTIMRNRWLKQLRHEACGPEFVALDDAAAERWLLDSDLEPGHLCERIWERDEIRTALGELPVGQREIIPAAGHRGIQLQGDGRHDELPDRYDHVAAFPGPRQVQAASRESPARLRVGDHVAKDVNRWRRASVSDCR